MRILMILGLLFFTINTTAQKKVMQHEDKALWNRIKNVEVSNSGDYMLYNLGPEEKDQTLHLHDMDGRK